MNGRRMTLALYAWGAVPLLLGTGAFTLWFLTRGTGFIVAGLMVIFLGVAATAGFSAHLALALARKRRTGFPGWKTAVAAAALMLANYPAAFGLVMAYDFICTRAYIRLDNRSGGRLTGIELAGPGGKRGLGVLENGRSRRAFSGPGPASWSGPLVLTFDSGEETVRLVLTEYLVTDAGRAAWRVTVEPGPELSRRSIFRTGH